MEKTIDIFEAAQLIGIGTISHDDVAALQVGIASNRVCKSCASLEANCSNPARHDLYIVTYTPPEPSDQQTTRILNIFNR